MSCFWLTISTQLVVCLVLLFGDIGFDKRGRFGLDFDHLVFIGVFQLLLFVTGFVIATRSKEHSLRNLLIQTAMIPATIIALVVGDLA